MHSAYWVDDNSQSLGICPPIMTINLEKSRLNKGRTNIMVVTPAKAGDDEEKNAGMTIFWIYRVLYFNLTFIFL